MIIVSTPEIPNKTIIETCGIARGSTVRARNVGRDIFASFKNLIGGEGTPSIGIALLLCNNEGGLAR